MSSENIYSFTVKDILGQEKSLQEYKGKVLLIVNVASECGFTPQYVDLQEVYSQYKDKGFVVLGFPCNQFGAQEKGSDAEIKKFCDLKYRVTFPMFSKIDVNGENAHPLYKFLTKEKSGFLGTQAIKWNFTKFLIDRAGNVVDRFASTTNPKQMVKDIEKLL